MANVDRISICLICINAFSAPQLTVGACRLRPPMWYAMATMVVPSIACILGIVAGVFTCADQTTKPWAFTGVISSCIAATLHWSTVDMVQCMWAILNSVLCVPPLLS